MTKTKGSIGQMLPNTLGRVIASTYRKHRRPEEEGKLMEYEKKSYMKRKENKNL